MHDGNSGGRNARHGYLAIQSRIECLFLGPGTPRKALRGLTGGSVVPCLAFLASERQEGRAAVLDKPSSIRPLSQIGSNRVFAFVNKANYQDGRPGAPCT